MELTRLPFHASLELYQEQAEQLLDAWKAGHPTAIQIVRQSHPRFLDATIPWLPKKMSESELRSATLDASDAQLVIARWYDFQSWARLAEYVEAVTQEGSPVAQFEAAVEAVIGGDVGALAALLRAAPRIGPGPFDARDAF